VFAHQFPLSALYSHFSRTAMLFATTGTQLGFYKAAAVIYAIPDTLLAPCWGAQDANAFNTAARCVSHHHYHIDVSASPQHLNRDIVIVPHNQKIDASFPNPQIHDSRVT
jgi:hypothetical protein